MREIGKRIKGKEYAILMHRHADPDAVASAAGLLKIVKGKLYAPGGLSSLGKKVAEFLGLKISEGPVTEDRIIVVDTASSTQLPGVNLHDKEVVRIDHHATGDIGGFTEPSASSTSELIALMLKDLGIKPDWKTATALMAGILYDSKQLRISRPETFEALWFLSVYGGKTSEAYNLLENKQRDDFSIRVAKMKACQRLKFYKVKDLIIAITEIGSHESSVIKMLLENGADVVYVVSVREGETRVYGRLSKRALNLGLDVSEILKELAEDYGGSGGGHKGAGGAILKGSWDFEELCKKLYGRTSRKIAEVLRKYQRE